MSLDWESIRGEGLKTGMGETKDEEHKAQNDSRALRKLFKKVFSF